MLLLPTTGHRPPTTISEYAFAHDGEAACFNARRLIDNCLHAVAVAAELIRHSRVVYQIIVAFVSLFGASFEAGSELQIVARHRLSRFEVDGEDFAHQRPGRAINFCEA